MMIAKPIMLKSILQSAEKDNHLKYILRNTWYKALNKWIMKHTKKQTTAGKNVGKDN